MSEWWLRTVLVLQAPRAVFAALRDDSPAAASDRAEQVLLVVLLAGMAIAVASGAETNGSTLLFVTLVFLAGGATGAAAYWLLGAMLYAAVRALGSQGSYRRARHVLAFACVPLALSLVVAPAGHGVYAKAILVFAAWSAVLLVIGVRAVHGWSWPRAGVGAAAPVVVAAVLAALG